MVVNHIGRMTRGARKTFLHAQRDWSEVIGVTLLPYAWKYYECRYNDLQLDDKGHLSLQKYSRLYESFKIQDYHTFGCLGYILEDKLQTA